MRRLGLWWRQPDHYVWISDYVADKGLRAVMRVSMAVIMAVLTAVAALMLVSPSGPRGTWGRGVAVAVVVWFAAMTVLWVLRWPTARQSRVLSVVGVVGIAGLCVVVSDPRSALGGCAAFAGVAGYVAFLHSARYLVFVIVSGFATVVFSANRVAAAGDPAMAAAGLLLLGAGVFAVPIAGQILVHWLSVDARQSSIDALTGLWNRRGFYRSARDLIAGGVGVPPPWFTVVMIDLDGFKRVNDTLGHPTGDAILVDVAEGLREASGDDAVIARVGGEEFLVAEVCAENRLGAGAERLRATIADNPWEVTASLGSATVRLSGAEPSTRVLIERLVHAADAAMYEAKRAGGNQVRIAEPPITGPDSGPLRRRTRAS